MSDRAIELINELLKIYNTESGEYLKLVGDKTKNTPTFTTEVKINDVNTGAISNILEYTRRLNSFFVNQLNLKNTVGDWLDYIGTYIYNINRLAGESDTDYSERIIITTAKIKVTPLALRDMLENYGDNVQILEDDVGAFANVSFSNADRNFNTTPIVTGAIAGQLNGLVYFFRIIMTNVSVNDYRLIINLINDYRAAGISYILEIN